MLHPYCGGHKHFKLKIVSITKQGVKVKKLDIVQRQEKKVLKSKKRYDLRDPFWPVDYTPA